MLLFFEVAQQLSFSKAAEQLDISRSYLSQQIRQLEQDFNTQLLVRTTRKVRLTTEGQQVLLQAQAIRHGLLGLERDLKHSDKDVTGVLRITAPSSFADTFLVDACSEFNRSYPEVSFEIEIGHKLENLHERNFVLAIRVTDTPPQNMVARKLMSYCHWVVASPEYLSCHALPLHPDDLSALDCLVFPNWRNWHFLKDGQSHQIETQGRFACSDNSMLVKAAIQHQGVVRVPEHLLWAHVKFGRLQRLLSDYQLEPRQVWMLYPPKIDHSSRLQVFVAYLQHFIEKNIDNQLKIEER
ncbi:LysR family transcriptional regulator [Vibrio algarum]|uniref:LysR family transcriptional regulator n=1 Tax=Vibrio algarum TaxID=3020714 RepID=A0ABT4YVE2_9VIBR|nr:LysR family transcriptional regulator [Vibrio sp. KJ40-1]MDB1125357.1 LysR family transcriptional regulator [Vibrio sp. KJ40-1]